MTSLSFPIRTHECGVKRQAEFPADNHLNLTGTTVDFEAFSLQMHQSSPNAHQPSNAHLQGLTASLEYVEDDSDDRVNRSAEAAQPKQSSPIGMKQSSQKSGRNKKEKKQLSVSNS
jgi:hypothetical protein